jgi:hypothetical protein
MVEGAVKVEVTGLLKFLTPFLCELLRLGVTSVFFLRVPSHKIPGRAECVPGFWAMARDSSRSLTKKCVYALVFSGFLG